MKIQTKKSNTNTGRPIIVAKAEGSQKTTSYDLSKSASFNHGAAAAALLEHMDKKDQGLRTLQAVASLAAGIVQHEDNGAVHTFVI